jgi:peptidoglycan hydrolase-like protein with peptidoglycan-binding domain
MTPRQACIVLVGFVLLAAGVAVNALYLQGEAGASRRAAGDASTARPPADRAQRTDARDGRPGARATPADQPKRAAMLKPDPKADAPPEAPLNEASADTIRAIQRELKQRGLGSLASDGIVRPATRAAIMAFEHDNQLPLTGEATDALLKRILLGASAASDSSGAGEVRSPHAQALIRHVQRLLTARGYRPGPIDGRFSAETVAAIRVFETDQGLVPKGRISVDMLGRLDAPAGPKTAAR